MTGAYQFTSPDATTDNLLERLNQLGKWQWHIGDSHWYGDYLGCSPFPGVRLRICDFPVQVESGYQYQSDVRLSAECRTPMTEIDAAFRALLAEICASEVKEIQGFD
jgi:hypothetical protein